MVKLMLHHAGKIALYPFVMVLERLIVPFHMDTGRTHHLLVDEISATIILEDYLRSKK
jgi:hypothetical protein